MQEREYTKKNATGGRKVGYRGEMKISRKTVETGGARGDRTKLLTIATEPR